MTTVDTVMCGHVAAEELAYHGIAIAPHLAFLLVGIGLLMGTVVLTARPTAPGVRRNAAGSGASLWSTAPRSAACSVS